MKTFDYTVCYKFDDELNSMKTTEKQRKQKDISEDYYCLKNAFSQWIIQLETVI